MRIGIDAHMVGARETGNESYVLGLASGLSRSADGASCVYFVRAGAERVRAAAGRRARIWKLRSPWATLRIPFELPLAARRAGADLLHTTYVGPPFAHCPRILTVHDLAFADMPSLLPLKVRVVLSLLVPLSVRRAAAIIVPSQFTRDRLLSRYRTPRDKIAVIPYAPSEIFLRDCSPATIEQVRARYRIDGPFFLAVGGVHPKKNVRRLLVALASLQRNGGAAHRLLIVGPAGPPRGAVLRKAWELGVDDSISILGYVPERDLMGLYHLATGLVYPSLYEGFGLPPLEAMASGTPVIASHSTALPEVLGDSAILVDPTSATSIAEAMALLAEDESLRKRLAERGRRRAAEFDWTITADMTLEVYRRALNAQNDGQGPGVTLRSAAVLSERRNDLSNVPTGKTQRPSTRETLRPPQADSG